MKQVTRRNFIKDSSVIGLGLWLGISKSHAQILAATNITEAQKFTPYILVEPNGNITIFNIKPEMGQGTFQSIPSLIAEEFEVSLGQVIIKQTNGELEYGRRQNVGGSNAVRSSYEELRKVGASAKEVFIQAAAAKWNVSADECYAENAKVIHKPSNRSLRYTDLVEEASKIELPKNPKLKDPKDFKILGKSVKRPDIPLKINGKAEFGIDTVVPDMLYASVERCPILGGTLKSFDASAALQMPGVIKVVEAERVVGRYTYKGVAAIASSYWAALQARKAIKIEWDTNGYETFHSATYEKELRSLAQKEGVTDKVVGTPDAPALPNEEKIEAFYETPMVAHHALEPLNCVVHVVGDKVDIWTSTQVASAITATGPNDFHKTIGFAPEKITLHNKFIGGGFGRRLYTDFISEAVTIARQTEQPVKVIWSREDTTQFGPFRPMTFSAMKGSVTKNGKVVSFHHKVIAPSMIESSTKSFDKNSLDRLMIEGIAEQEYEMPNLKTSYVRADYHVPVAAWRSVTSSTLAFPHECFIDELAHKAHKDPFTFRLEMLSKPSDTKRIFDKLKEVSNWNKPLPPNKGRGMAQWKFFAGQSAHVVEVTYNRAKHSIKIDKVYVVIDLGKVVNPDNVKNQVEGAIVMALSAATQPGITLEQGKVVQSNFSDNPQARINEVPPIEVHILADGGPIKGVGEPGLPPFAPALVNAIFAAAGKRIRKLPFDLDNI
jgi:isoquinoline 1-oxidoreductase beta subunit